MWKYVWVKKCVEMREMLFKNWKWLFEITNQTPPQSPNKTLLRAWGISRILNFFCKFIDNWWEWVMYYDRLSFTAWYTLSNWRRSQKSNFITTLYTLASTLHFTNYHNDIKKDWSRWWPAILILYYTLVLLTECFCIDSLIMWIYI